MEQSEIQQQARKMNTVADLAKLLNAIKRDLFNTAKHPISEAQLKYFSSDRIAPKRFRTFHIRKKSGGLRDIKAPCYKLGIILNMTNRVLRSLYEPSDAAMGFARGRSVAANASMHVGHNYVFNIDLKDFFPSIPQPRVWKRLQLPPFNFSREIANVVAGLCCSYDETRGRNVLPQGAATSPLLTNAICDNLDRRMKGVANRFGLHYSRYADDMTFSSMHNVYQEGSDFRLEIKRIIEQQGFEMNDKKTRLLKGGRRQEVTGLTVNTKVNVTRKYVKDLRWILHVWEKFGYARAYASFYPRYKHEKGYIKKGEPVMENVIAGKLDYLRMVRGSTNDAYKKLAERYSALQTMVYIDTETNRKKQYIYVQPYSMDDFETLFHTKISLEVSAGHKLVGKCEIDGREKTMAISRKTQIALCPNLYERAKGDIVDSDELKGCFVTLCRAKGKNFWLITKEKLKRSKCLSIQHAHPDIDKLLAIWEQDGFDKAAIAFKAFLNQEDEQTGTDNVSKKQSGMALQKDSIILIKFLTISKNLTSEQRKKVYYLLSRDFSQKGGTGVVDRYVLELLEIWEKDGIDAAVKRWKATRAGSTINRSIPNQPSKPYDDISIEAIKGIIEDIKNGTEIIDDSISIEWD